MEIKPKKTQEEIDKKRLSLQETLEKAAKAADALLKKKNKSEEIISTEKVGENFTEVAPVVEEKNEVKENKVVETEEKEGIETEKKTNTKETDENYEKAKEIVLNSKDTSFSNLAKKLKISERKAKKLLDELEKEGIVGPDSGASKREFLGNKVASSATRLEGEKNIEADTEKDEEKNLETTPEKTDEKESVEKNDENKEEEKETVISPEQIRTLEEILGEAEAKRALHLESSKFKNGIIKGLDKWENFGKGEEGIKGFAKRFSKTAINLALIGAISSISVEKLAEMGVGTATALGGGVTSYLGRKMATGLSLGAIMEVGGKKIPDKIKKWMPEIMAVGGVAIALSGGGVAVAGASVLGYLSSKLIKGKFTNEKIADRQGKATQKLLGKYEDENGKVDLNNISKIEAEYEKILKKYENQRIWGKVADGVMKLGVGSLVSGLTLEASGYVHDHTNHNKTEEVIKSNSQKETEGKIENNNQNNDLKHQAELKEQEEAKNNTDQLKETIIHKNEGIEHSLIRQIEGNHDLAKELGYKGDLNDIKALHHFAGHEAHVLAIKEGYVDKFGNEVRVAEADKLGYEIKTENGHISIEEKTIDGKMIETHHEGDKFENNPDKGEYIKHDSVKNENISHDKTTPSNEYAAPKQVDPITGEPIRTGVSDILDKSDILKNRAPEQVNPITGEPNTHEPVVPTQVNPLTGEVEHTQETTQTAATQVEPVVPETKLVDFKFDNPDHVIPITENGSEIGIKFIYDSNHHILGTDVAGHANIDTNSYIDNVKIHELSGFRQMDASRDIFEMAKEIKFLDRIPHNTNEYQYLHNHIVEMQKDIIKNYGDIINHDKLITDNSILSPVNHNSNETAPAVHNSEIPLNTEQLLKMETVIHHNIEHIFPKNNQYDTSWDEAKGLKSAILYHMRDDAVKPGFQSLYSHLHHLHDVTGLEPKEGTMITSPETNDEFIKRATEEAAKQGKLDQIEIE